MMKGDAADEWMDHLEMNDLPIRMREVAEIVGVKGALFLSRTFGGGCVYIPTWDVARRGLEMGEERRLRDFRSIAARIGNEAALKLARRYAGEFVYIHKMDQFLRRRRDELIRRARAEGESYMELRGQFGVSTRWVREICDHRGDDRQMELF